MTAASCPIPDPPHDCPLRGWEPKRLIAGYNPETKMFEKIAVIECEICGMRWTPEGDTIG